MPAHRALPFALALVLAACGAGSAKTTPSGGAAGSPTGGGSSAASATAPAAPSPAGSASAGDSSASPAIAIDPSLLGVLPAQLAGLDRQHDPTIDAGAFADPSLSGIATGGVTALYIDPPSGQFAYAAVIRLATGDLTDAQFRDGRATCDHGACAPSGGVGGHAESTIGGHDTYIGTCTGGLTTYHTILTSRGLLVSISAIGDRRLGEQLVSALPS